MSTSTITCRACKRQVAVRHHSGQIRVVAGVMVVITHEGVRLTCACGAVRVIEERKAA